MRLDSNASRIWFGCARFRTVLLNNTSSSSCSRLNRPVSGCSPVLTTTPSRTHCQNWACVVQNCFRSLHITSAVFFFRIFFVLIVNTPRPLRICRHTQKSRGEASLARQQQIFKLLKTEFP